MPERGEQLEGNGMSDGATGMLSGKVCVVMGVANRWSIAYAIGEAMLNAGATLAVSYLDERMKRDCDALIRDSPDSKLYPCNVESDEELDALGESLEADYGKIDCFVHSVAFAPAAELANRFLETSRSGFSIAMSISVYSLIATAQRLVPLMADGGSILTLTYLGSERAFPRYNVMGIAKAGLESTVRYLAYDLGGENIRVNAISAGPIKTASARGIPGFSDMVEIFGQRAPIKTPFAAPDVANLAVFLASDHAKAITAETIYVDNGYHAMGM
jgi:enoyl-[acyl-carrier protein] reductase I